MLLLLVGESMKPDGMLAIVEWEGDIPYMYFFKDGILPEKVVSIDVYMCKIGVKVKLIFNIK